MSDWLGNSASFSSKLCWPDVKSQFFSKKSVFFCGLKSAFSNIIFFSLFCFFQCLFCHPTHQLFLCFFSFFFFPWGHITKFLFFNPYLNKTKHSLDPPPLTYWLYFFLLLLTLFFFLEVKKDCKIMKIKKEKEKKRTCKSKHNPHTTPFATQSPSQTNFSIMIFLVSLFFMVLSLGRDMATGRKSKTTKTHQ